MTESTDDGSQVRLVGRRAELAALEGLLDTVASQSALVVVQGEAGQGKSSLLRWTAASARRRNYVVLSTAGMEFERGLAFGGLAGLLRPLLDRLGDLDDPQRHALDVALGRAAGEAPALVIYTATLTLLASAAEREPVVVVVDDAQWLDDASLKALLFAARGSEQDRVGFVFAQRVGVPCLLDDPRFERVELSDLDRDAAAMLLATAGVAPPVAERCWERTGGNPLALIEGTRRLTARQRSGEDPLPAVLPAATRLLVTFQERLIGLPDATVGALGLASLEPTNDLVAVATALQATGGSVADLEPAERHEIVSLSGGRVRWLHPLMRSAVHQQIDVSWRRRAHRALADAQQAAGHDDTALWHLSEASVGPDDGLASQLDALGLAARRRGALAAASEAFEQAARLSTTAIDRDRRILAAADARWRGGDLSGTTDLLGRRIAAVHADDLAAHMAMILGQAELWTVGPSTGTQRFEHHASAVADTRPALAAFLLMHATTAQMLALDPAAVATAERAITMADRSGDAGALFGASAMHALARFFKGTADSAPGQLEPMTPVILAALESRIDGASELAQLYALAMMACERWTEATSLLRRVIHLSDTAGMVARGAFARLLLSEVQWRTGRWTESLTELTHSMTLLDSVRPGYVAPGTLALLARLEGGFGHSDSCRAHVAQVLQDPPHIEIFTVIAHSALGLLELGAGRPEQASAAFDQIVPRAAEVGEPGLLWWQGDAIEAYAACGRTSDARRVLERLEAEATTTGRRWALATAARGRGVLAQDGRADEHLSAALSGFRSIGSPFDEARTLLVRGHHRIRSGAREDGSHDLAAARNIFNRLGAPAWHERASAGHGDVPAAHRSLNSRLTPAELRVAMAVGRGASNRQAATQLFISAKTVEYHLRNIYRKLAISNRSQLVALILADARWDDDPLGPSE